jgi:signal transduction histidine kinase
VVAYDNDFSVLIFNPAAQEIFYLPENEVVGIKLSAAMASDPKFKVLAQVVFSSLAPTVIKRSDPGAYPQVIDVSFDEPKLDLRVVTDKIVDANGVATGFVKLITNRTREIELLKSKTEFITVAAHQLRTPLTAINWALESLETSQLNPQQKELADTGFLATKKMLKTVNDLLDVSKIEEGRFGYQFEEVNIVSFLEDILAQTNALAKQYGIKLYFARPKEQSIPVFIDQQKVNMVMSNLLDNAIKYNVENGEVTVAVEKEADEPFVKISIKDTGIGIPSNQLDKLFTKFFRADNVVKFSPDGTGMGLYIVKNVVNRHGGRVWAESELNRGTIFSFTLPTNKDVIPKKELVEFE